MIVSYSLQKIAIPLIPFLSSIAIYTLSLKFYRQRWLWLAPLLCCHYLAFTGSTYLPKEGIDSLWGLLTCIWASHSFSVLYLEDGSFSVGQKGVFEQQSWDCKFWATWNNPRLLFTSRAENHVSPAMHEGQSVSAFAINRLAKLAMYWFINFHVQPRLLPGPFVPLYAADFDDTRQTFLRRLLLYHGHQDSITTREISIRAAMAVYWAIGAYVLVDGAHSVLSLFFVGVVRANRPEEWPPIYGSISEAYSLRRFWGKFWHRLVVIPYGNVGKLFARRCLGLCPGSAAYKSIVACFIFVLSGTAHAAVAWRLGDHACWHLDIWWFFLNFVACGAEGFVFSQVSRKHGPFETLGERRIPLKNSIVRKCLGFSWVFLFFFWSVPKWQYPKLYSIAIEMSNRNGAKNYR